jgi:hypothetical protein
MKCKIIFDKFGERVAFDKNKAKKNTYFANLGNPSTNK